MKRFQKQDRRGAAIVAILVCFILAGAIFVSLVRSAAVARDAARRDHWRLQAEWLAEAALERAIARVDLDAEYAGETWTLGPEQFAGRRGAAVTIAVEPSADAPDKLSIQVVADFPDDPRHRCRCRKEIILERKESVAPKGDDETRKPETPEEPE
ncbi:MAG: hypothetical protein JW959_10245 [Pirellulales bacterium]|nr:hypothetical protein [Pirellulales bacterium]